MYVYCTIGMIQFGTKCDKLWLFFFKLRWPDDSNFDDILFTLLHLLIICQTVGDIALRYLSLSLCMSLFNNISVISWQSVLLVEETGVPGENHRPVESH
jgi:hypothetical protein